MNQGKGIYLVSSKEQLKEKLNINGESESSARRSVVRPPQGRVIQRYKLNALNLPLASFTLIKVFSRSLLKRLGRRLLGSSSASAGSLSLL